MTCSLWSLWSVMVWGHGGGAVKQVNRAGHLLGTLALHGASWWIEHMLRAGGVVGRSYGKSKHWSARRAAASISDMAGAGA